MAVLTLDKARDLVARLGGIAATEGVSATTSNLLALGGAYLLLGVDLQREAAARGGTEQDAVDEVAADARRALLQAMGPQRLRNAACFLNRIADEGEGQGNG